LLFSFLVWLSFVLVLYVVSVFVRSYRLYGSVVIEQRGEVSQIHGPDPLLGYAPLVNAESVQLMRKGTPVPVKFDASGFRVPADPGPESPDSGLTSPGLGSDQGQRRPRSGASSHAAREVSSQRSDNRSPRVLALGCSFTYGAACRAEEAYPFVVADQLGGSCLNAGVSGYGLTQMLLRGQQLIPGHRPDIVLVQYSPWLVDRAMSPYASSTLGQKPVPYFFDDGGKLRITGPVFRPYLVDPARYRSGRVSMLDYLAFVAQVGFPVLLHDDVCGAAVFLRQLVGNLPWPATDRQQVVDAVYGALAELCRTNDATLVIVIIDQDAQAGPRESLQAAPHALVVDAHQAMIDGLPLTGSITYQRFYTHWRGTPLEQVDHHPNPLAHSLIARATVEALRTRSPQPRGLR